MLILRRLDLPRPSLDEQHGSTRPLSAIMRQPVFIVAALGGITAYGVMNLLMAATPLAMQMCSHPYGAAMLVIEWHIIAMFAPAFGTGWLIARVGTLPVMFAGLAAQRYSPSQSRYPARRSRHSGRRWSSSASAGVFCLSAARPC